MSLFAKAQNSFLGPLVRFVFRVEIINRGSEPASGSYIVSGNHSSNYDPIILGASLTRPVRYMAKESLFKVPLLGRLIRALGAYPVNREDPGVGPIRTSLNLLKSGELISVFPQGHRFDNNAPYDTAKLKPGIGMFACTAEVGVLPVSIITKGKRTGFFRRTRLVIGEYIPYEVFAGWPESSVRYKEITEFVYKAITDNYEKYKF